MRVLRILLTLCALAPSAFAEEPAYTGGCPWTVGSYTNRLNSVSGTVESSSIDLASLAGIFVVSTGTAGTSVDYAWSHNNATWSGGGSIPLGNQCLEKDARYIKFIARSASAISPTAARVTLATAPATALAPPTSAAAIDLSTISGAAATDYFNKLSNTAALLALAVNAASTGIFAKLVGGDGTAIASATNGVPVNVVGSTGYGAVSEPAYSVLSGTVTTIELGAFTGATRACDVALTHNFGANATVNYVINRSATGPTDLGGLAGRGHPLAASATTQIMGPFLPGFYLHMQAEGILPTANDVTVHVFGRVTSTSQP